MTLSSLKFGDRAIITDVDATDRELFSRSIARGLVPGSEIKILRSGDPLLVTSDETRWAINRADAAKIKVSQITKRPSLLRHLFGRR